MAKKKGELFKMGEVVKRSGFTRQQIHNFLVMGLVKEKSRTSAGHRLFGAEMLKRLFMIRGLLAKGYALTEIRRTFRAFARLVLICILAALAAAVPASRGLAAAPPAPPAPPARLSAADRASIRKVFTDLEVMMKNSRAAEIRSLLATSLSRERVHQIAEQLDAEFVSRSYQEFKCAYDPEDDVFTDASAAGKVRVRAIISYQYYEIPGGQVLMGDPTGQAFFFDLAKGRDGWRISDDANFFDTLTSTGDNILSQLFLWVSVGLVVMCFWGWMFMDCCFREWGGRKSPWVLSLLVSLLLGLGALIAYWVTKLGWLGGMAALPGGAALVYFFAVWMRQGPED